MEVRKLTTELPVSPQIAASDLPAIRAAGFRAVICNRPDGEGADQPNFSEIQVAAHSHGIEAYYLPVESGKVSDAAYAQLGELLRTIGKPVLAYCRTGMRSATLWGLSEASTRPLPEILAAAKGAGYEPGALNRRLVNGGKVPSISVGLSSRIGC